MDFKVGDIVYLQEKISYWIVEFLEGYKNYPFEIIRINSNGYYDLKIPHSYESYNYSWKKNEIVTSRKMGIKRARIALPDKLFTMEI